MGHDGSYLANIIIYTFKIPSPHNTEYLHLAQYPRVHDSPHSPNPPNLLRHLSCHGLNLHRRH